MENMMIHNPLARFISGVRGFVFNFGFGIPLVLDFGSVCSKLIGKSKLKLPKSDFASS